MHVSSHSDSIDTNLTLLFFFIGAGGDNSNNNNTSDSGSNELNTALKRRSLIMQQGGAASTTTATTTPATASPNVPRKPISQPGTMTTQHTALQHPHVTSLMLYCHSLFLPFHWSDQ